jgi:hypothetical protein
MHESEFSEATEGFAADLSGEEPWRDTIHTAGESVQLTLQGVPAIHLGKTAKTKPRWLRQRSWREIEPLTGEDIHALLMQAYASPPVRILRRTSDLLERCGAKQ